MQAMNEPTEAAARMVDDLLLSVVADDLAATGWLVRYFTMTEGL